MKRIHFIAIGGAAMHNLAIALTKKGYEVSGSDDEIFEPSRSRLENYNILPEKFGWYPEKINESINAIILGMHARKDNSELLEAQKKGLKIYSYPEFLYEQTRNKKRIIIAGSHGKTTITAMVIHVLTTLEYKIDFMVGSQIAGFDTMVSLNEESEYAVFEGDEYLSSPLDLRPKFMHYKPDIALITGIAWDHINVFPTFEDYVKQFRNLIESIQAGGSLVYFEGDDRLVKESELTPVDVSKIGYGTHPYKQINNQVELITADKRRIPIRIFGQHNFQNLEGARRVCNLLGVSDGDFYEAIAHFEGTKKRLQVLIGENDYTVYLDFAHSPSKLAATVNAVRERHPKSRLVGIFELHTFSSLNKDFIPLYKGTLSQTDQAVVYYDRRVIEYKGLDSLSRDFVKEAFANPELIVIDQLSELEDYIASLNKDNLAVLLMSSGNFSGLDMEQLFKKL